MCLGVPGQVVEEPAEVDGLLTGLVEFAGARRRVCLACVPGVRAGDYVLVHAGVAITAIDPDEADRLLADLRTLGEEIEA